MAVCGLLALLAAIVYGQTLWHGFLDLDDFDYVLNLAVAKSGRWDKDLAANAESLGAMVLRPVTLPEFRDALATARANEVTTVVCIHTDPTVAAPDSESWWDVPVAEVSTRRATAQARSRYEVERRVQRHFLGPTLHDGPPSGI